MDLEILLNLLLSLSPWIFIKIFFLVILLFYFLFAAIIYRQIMMMNEVIEAQISPILSTIALLHLGGAIFVFFLALVLI